MQRAVLCRPFLYHSIQNKISRAGAMCKRQVIDNGQPAQGFDIDVMRHGGHWIDEEKHGIKLPFTDHRTQLLIPTQRTAFQAGHIQGALLQKGVLRSDFPFPLQV